MTIASGTRCLFLLFAHVFLVSCDVLFSKIFKECVYRCLSKNSCMIIIVIFLCNCKHKKITIGKYRNDDDEHFSC